MDFESIWLRVTFEGKATVAWCFAQHIEDEYLDVLPVDPDQDVSAVVRFFTHHLDDLVATWVLALGTPLGLLSNRVARGDTDLVRAMKASDNTEIHVAIPKARVRVQQVLFGMQLRRRLKYVPKCQYCLIHRDSDLGTLYAEMYYGTYSNLSIGAEGQNSWSDAEDNTKSLGYSALEYQRMGGITCKAERWADVKDATGWAGELLGGTMPSI